ncbi:MAG: hypothetical protein OEN01_06470 [Candidatus Krumholzibacteria bacterium]|nr:hypothetical protein [Candidatus Krumholzibacteria bacterium]
MGDVRSPVEHRVDKVACPLCGDNVTVSATYRHSDVGHKCLVDFGCNMEMACGIPSWDPCPLYVAYLEEGFVT